PQAADAHEPRPPRDGHATRMLCRPPMEISGIPTSGGRASTSRCGPTTSGKPPLSMDRDRSNRPQTVPEPGVAAEPGLELVGAEGSTELPRQNSNLRPVDAERTQPRAREQKRKRLARTKPRRKS